ncbi:hypothetical protein BKA82DRAFT_4127501 [Pisolithus tinctorius]|nr:hypothetical protein BKA82DRAFT_4127501 [Pisolithus tinctorius]
MVAQALSISPSLGVLMSLLRRTVPAYSRIMCYNFGETLILHYVLTYQIVDLKTTNFHDPGGLVLCNKRGLFLLRLPGGNNEELVYKCLRRVRTAA